MVESRRQQYTQQEMDSQQKLSNIQAEMHNVKLENMEFKKSLKVYVVLKKLIFVT